MGGPGVRAEGSRSRRRASLLKLAWMAFGSLKPGDTSAISSRLLPPEITITESFRLEKTFKIIESNH